MPTITYLPMGIIADYQPGESVFEVGRRAGIPIETACVGKATCGLCRVKVIAGAEHLNPFNDDEAKHLGNVYFITQVRLSCQMKPTGGDITVELAPKRTPTSR
ncbi:MAG TPA: 2Fe-2S iron-sulfur cluster-binding protein [Kofleriaceae bacterium]|nr:2Fe-2S iron-sulfur cluster-binding protein [Kofleriaceae bacterium]